MIGRAPYVSLLVALLLVLVGTPFVPLGLLGVATLDLFLLAAFVAALFSCTDLAWHRGVALTLGASAWLGRAVGALTASEPLLTSYPLLGVLFLSYVTILLGRGIFRHEGDVTGNVLCGAVSIYLLLGFVWAFGYALIERLEPGSIRGSAEGPLDLQQLIGFSFVTLTTLGYGDVVPVTQRARTLATAEAIAGQLYLAVLVARLVGLHLAQRINGKTG